jgi:Ser/Thr protein kinase RdoA (MazF antagonist)
MPIAPPPAAEQVDRVLSRFGLERRSEPVSMYDSVLNHNYRVQTGGGPRFVKFIQQKRTYEVVSAEHRAMRFAGERGIPVALPDRDASGESVIDLGGQLAAVYPFIEGRTADRHAITDAEAAALGDTLGRLQSVLAGYRDEILSSRPSGEVTWNPQRSEQELLEVRSIVRAKASLTEADRWALAGIEGQLGHLRAGDSRDPAEFAWLPMQLEHGDFHERNVIFSRSGEVAAVVDWERIRELPRAFQMVRAVDFIGLLADGPVEPFLAGYGRHMCLSREECAAAVEHWWQNVFHNTWAYTDYYLRGNLSVGRFFADQVPRLERLADPAYRGWLAALIARHCA